jgi:DNA-directed RNA polymerase specialized sigma24 family protein
MNFWEREAYDIAKRVTGGNPLYRDLVSHIYLLLYKYELDEESLPRMFARFCWNQYNWRDSEFNKQFRFPGVELFDQAKPNDDELPESEFKILLENYLEKLPSNDQELFIKEVTKMHLYGMTYREIKDNTGLSLDTIHKTIKQFKYDLFIYSDRPCESESITRDVPEH